MYRQTRKVEAHQSDRATAILRDKLLIVSGVHKEKKKKKMREKKGLLPSAVWDIFRESRRREGTIVRYAVQFRVSFFLSLEAILLVKCSGRCSTRGTVFLG